MKKHIWTFPVLAVLVIWFAGCGSQPNTVPSAEKTIVTIKRDKALSVGSLKAWNVYIDDEKVGSLKNGKQIKVLVTKGTHLMYVESSFMKSDTVGFTAASKELVFTASISSGLLLNTLYLVEGDKPAAGTARGKKMDKQFEDALQRASQTIIAALAANSTIAVLSVSSNDAEAAAFVVDELEYIMVNTRKFKMVDRKTLDSIRAEQKFQMSGEVSDSSAVSIGKLLGATTVITGSISGSGDTRRLSLKALDVRTAQIITMARESF